MDIINFEEVKARKQSETGKRSKVKSNQNKRIQKLHQR